MSKSFNNSIYLNEIHDLNALKLFFLSQKYTKPSKFNMELINQNTNKLIKIKNNLLLDGKINLKHIDFSNLPVFFANLVSRKEYNQKLIYKFFNNILNIDIK